MNKPKILTLASMVALLLAPAAFSTSTEYQPDTMATEFLWTPKQAQALALGEPDTMATEFLWTPKQVQPAGYQLAGVRSE